MTGPPCARTPLLAVEFFGEDLCFMRGSITPAPPFVYRAAPVMSREAELDFFDNRAAPGTTGNPSLADEQTSNDFKEQSRTSSSGRNRE